MVKFEGKTTLQERESIEGSDKQIAQNIFI